MTGKKGSLQQTSPGPLNIRHAQVVARYEEYKKRNPNYTETQISEKVAFFFNHSSDVSRGYVRKISNSLSDPLATKKGVSPSAVTRPAIPLPPIDESEGGGESKGGGESSGGPPPLPRKPLVPKARQAARKAAKAPAPPPAKRAAAKAAKPRCLPRPPSSPSPLSSPPSHRLRPPSPRLSSSARLSSQPGAVNGAASQTRITTRFISFIHM